MTVPPEAVTAAVEALRRTGWPDVQITWPQIATQALEAAAPLIAAAERDRIRTLAIAHAAAADTQASSDNAKIPGATLRRFADLLAGDQ
jgi:hypothetical protein